MLNAHELFTKERAPRPSVSLCLVHVVALRHGLCNVVLMTLWMISSASVEVTCFLQSLDQCTESNQAGTSCKNHLTVCALQTLKIFGWGSRGRNINFVHLPVQTIRRGEDSRVKLCPSSLHADRIHSSMCITNRFEDAPRNVEMEINCPSSINFTKYAWCSRWAVHVSMPQFTGIVA